MDAVTHPVRLGRIFHPTDLSAVDEPAFAHALRLAWAAPAELTLFHVRDGRAAPGRPVFPSVRGWLGRWGLLAPGASRRDVVARGMEVKKIEGRGDPLEAMSHRLERHPTDLVVLYTHRGGVLHAGGRPLAGPLARRSQAMTLFLPEGAKGFVDASTGRVGLHRILLPVAGRPAPHRGLQAAATLAKVLEARDAAFTLLHAGREDGLPLLDPPPGGRWERLVTEGDPVEVIRSAAARLAPDLIVMPTAGREGFLDVLRGSTTERVLRAAGCPVLAVPA